MLSANPAHSYQPTLLPFCTMLSANPSTLLHTAISQSFYPSAQCYQPILHTAISQPFYPSAQCYQPILLPFCTLLSANPTLLHTAISQSFYPSAHCYQPILPFCTLLSANPSSLLHTAISQSFYPSAHCCHPILLSFCTLRSANSSSLPLCTLLCISQSFFPPLPRCHSASSVHMQVRRSVTRVHTCVRDCWPAWTILKRPLNPDTRSIRPSRRDAFNADKNGNVCKTRSADRSWGI